jgi:hypothetical protein
MLEFWWGRYIIPLYAGISLELAVIIAWLNALSRTDLAAVTGYLRMRIVRFKRLPIIFSYVIISLLAV